MRRGPGSRQQYAGFELVVSSGTVRTLAGSSVSPPRLTFSRERRRRPRGRMSSAVNSQRRSVGFLSYADSANGGYGSVLFEVSFDSGAHWLTLYETGVVDRLGGIVAIAEPGRDYEFRVTLTNDAQGRGAEVYKLLFCTDPSVWA